jgi:predicted MFS family arabinose efflux permease
VRRSIIAMGTALWSLMTAASGFAQTFLQMSLARIGVGVGEAALSPPAHSLLADYFPVERRATALGVYSMGIHIGILFGVLAGGWLDEFFGWRMAFVVVGLPGLLVAALVRFTIREPERDNSSELPSVSAVFAYLWSRHSFRHLAFATSLVAFAGYAFATWAPTFLRRVHDMSGGELGTKYGLALGVGGAIGSVLAGVVADRLGKSDRRWWLWVPAFAAAGPLPFVLGFYFLPDPDLALLCVFPGLIIAAMYQGPVFSTVQTLVPVRMRAVASGILLFVINIIGLGLGPQSVGLLNDYVFKSHGDEAIRYSLTVVFVVMGIWGAVHFALGARALRADLERSA